MAVLTLPLDYDIVLYSGTSYRREFRWLPDGVLPMDFTGWHAQMRFGQPQMPATVQLSDTTGGVGLSNTGRIIITLTPSQTAALLPSVLVYYNLDLTEPNGFVRRFLRGRVSVVRDVDVATP